MTDLFNQEEYQSKYARMWLDPQIRDGLIAWMRMNGGVDRKVSEKMLIEAHFKRYLEISNTEKMQLLVHHPGLLKQDLEKVKELTEKQQVSQLKAALVFTTLSYTFYHLLLRRRRMFYDYFNKGRLRMLKKGSGIFGLFVFQMNILKYGYDKTVPAELEQAGLLKRYYIDIEKEMM